MNKLNIFYNVLSKKIAFVDNRTYAPCFQFCSFYKTGGAAR